MNYDYFKLVRQFVGQNKFYQFLTKIKVDQFFNQYSWFYQILNKIEFGSF